LLVFRGHPKVLSNGNQIGGHNGALLAGCGKTRFREGFAL